jgi:tetratricopeptide (TPR) repeat protein
MSELHAPKNDVLGNLPDRVIDRFRKQSQLDFEISFFDAILRRSPDYVDVLRCQGELLSRKGFHRRALVIDRRLAELLPADSVVQYNLACSLSRNALFEEALAALRIALECGYDDFEYLDLDGDFDALRSDSRYQTLVAEFRPEPVAKRRSKRSRRKS